MNSKNLSTAKVQVSRFRKKQIEEVKMQAINRNFKTHTISFLKTLTFLLIFSLPLQLKTASAQQEHSPTQQITALEIHSLIQHGEIDPVILLIHQGDIDANMKIGTSGESLLHIATQFGRFELVKFLLRSSAEVNIRDNVQRTALHIVSFLTQQNAEKILQLLLDNGADVDVRDSSGRTPLDRAASVRKTENLARLLLEANADVDPKDNQERTPLRRTAIRTQSEEGAARVLLDYDANINARSGEQTHLKESIEKSNRPMTNLLLVRGANPNIAFTTDTTPLHSAISHLDMTSAAWLVAHGATFTQVNDYFERWIDSSPLDSQSLKRYKNALKKLFEQAETLQNRVAQAKHKMTSSALQSNPSIENADLGRLLPLHDERSTQIRNSIGDTLLHEAARRGDFQSAQRLLAKGADVNAQNIFGESPLSEALRVRNLDMAKFLYANGADIYQWNYLGDTLLHQVIRRGQRLDLILARWLVTEGADVNAQNIFGDTPLHEAAFDEKIQVLNFLLRNGAKTDIQNHLQLTPLQMVDPRPALTLQKLNEWPNTRALREGSKTKRVLSLLEDSNVVHCGY